MAIIEKKLVDRRLTPKGSQDPTKSRHVMLGESEVDIATVLANELRSSMSRCGDPSSDSLSDILLDRELNGYRVILMRGSFVHEPTTPLSPREQEIARMVAKGYPNKTIAAVLEISTWTVGTHLRRMFAKLGVNSRAAMVAHLIRLHGVK